MSQIFSNVYDDFLKSLSAMLADITKRNYDFTAELSGVLSKMAGSIAANMVNVDINSSLAAIRDELKKSCLEISSKVSYTGMISLSSEFGDWLADVVAHAEPYMSEKEHKECAETIVSQLKAHEPRALSLDNAIKLIELLLTVLTLIITTLPDARLDQIIEQNDKLIAIEEERLELERNRIEEIENIAQELVDAIGCLNEQIEMQTDQFNMFGDHLDGADDLNVLQGKAEDADCEDQNDK